MSRWVMARLTRENRSDRGITLVESIVALFILAVVLAGAGMAALTSVRGTVVARANQQAANVLVEQVERVRAMDYAAITMVQSDLVGDSAIAGSGPWTYEGRPLVVDTVGLISPHTTTVTRNNVSYRVSRYVTDVSIDDGDDAYDAGEGTSKQLTVVANWSLYGQVKSKSTSVVLADARRGLPLPKYTFALNGPSSPQAVGAGDVLAWGFRIENLGARDAWNIAVDDGNTWAYYVDVDEDGLLDAGETEQLLDSDSNGVRDTGLLEPNGSAYFVATRTTTTSEFSPQTSTFSASSAAQPPPASTPQSVPTSVTLTGSSGGGAACPTGLACSLRPYSLDQIVNGATVSTNPMLLARTATLQSTVHDYSSERASAVGGRYLRTGGSGAAEADLTDVLDFRFQVPQGQSVTVSGSAGLQIWVRCLSPGTPSGLSVYVGDSQSQNMNSFTTRGSGTTSAAACEGATFVPMTVTVPVTQFATSKYITVRIMSSAVGSSDLRLLYDTVGAAATLTLPEL